MIKESLSAIIVKYKEPIEVTKECIDSLENQKNVKLEIIFGSEKIYGCSSFARNGWHYRW